eukprot:3417817-Prymnesium_polylepis.1
MEPGQLSRHPINAVASRRTEQSRTRAHGPEGASRPPEDASEFPVSHRKAINVSIFKLQSRN